MDVLLKEEEEKTKKIINLIKEKNEEITDELLNILIFTIKSLDDIIIRHVNMLLKDNLNFVYISKTLAKIENKIIIYIEFIIKNNKKNIFIYENINGIKKPILLESIKDIYVYSLISIYILNNNDKIQYLFNINDFKIIIKDVKSIISLKLFLNTKNIKINDLIDILFYKYIYSPMETFYITHFLNDHKEQIINLNENYKLTIEFSSKINNNYKRHILYNIIKIFKIKNKINI